jgi:S-adenosylmethionine:tRNA ribosyltransferase-isomerase
MMQTSRLTVADFDYELPPELIAQEPLAERDASRLLVLDRSTGSVRHRVFRDLPSLLCGGDLLVVNDSRVIPARLFGRKLSGGRVELLLLRRTEGGCWESLAKPSRRLRVGTQLSIEPKPGRSGANSAAEVIEVLDDGRVMVQLDPEVEGNLERFGEAPLPPYITQALDDDERYQTVFASVPGSAAAPTAGLHFSEELVAAAKLHGVEVATVTLHVGLATFRPVTAHFVDEHRIHGEWCSVEAETAQAIVRTRHNGGRVVAVGTTAARTLETFGARLDRGDSDAFSETTNLYILPGYRWRVVDAMVTNFHLPRSTLLMMVSAFSSRDMIRNAYAEAIASKYRFYSFGDAMLIL